MIRYIKIGDQINEDSNDFAFFDTVIDKFLEFDGEQVFHNKKDFGWWCSNHIKGGPTELANRCFRLIPEDHE